MYSHMYMQYFYCSRILSYGVIRSMGTRKRDEDVPRAVSSSRHRASLPLQRPPTKALTRCAGWGFLEQHVYRCERADLRWIDRSPARRVSLWPRDVVRYRVSLTARDDLWRFAVAFRPAPAGSNELHHSCLWLSVARRRCKTLERRE